MFRTWWPTSTKHMEKAESEVLRDVLASPHLKVSQKFVNVFPKHSLNTIEIVRRHRDGESLGRVEQPNASSIDLPRSRTLVMAHGFGAGLGFWYRNLESIILGSQSNLKIVAFDWPGFGRSSRVPWNIEEFTAHLTHLTESENLDLHHPPMSGVSESVRRRLLQTETFFVESLEKWRVGVGAEDVILLGHSLGGYFASLYALRYPHRVRTLILASPVGIPSPPPNPPRRHWIVNFIFRLWSWELAPQSLVRLFGPWGPSLIHWFTKKRFGMDGEEAEVVSRYLYQISAAAPSGERVLFDVLAPGAFAHSPLHMRLHNLNKEMNICFIYGQGDWMDYRAAVTVSNAIGPKAKVYRIAHSGHQMYLENPPAFNELVSHICDHSDGDIPTPNIEGVETISVS